MVESEERIPEPPLGFRAEEPSELSGIGSMPWTGVLGVTAIATTVSLVLYHTFVSTGWDLGFFEQGLWALSARGVHALSTWGGYPVVTRDASWILWPLSYPYRMLGVGFLLTLQAFAYALGGYFLWNIADTAGTHLALKNLLLWLYMLSPLGWAALVFDFHPVVLAIPALLAAYAAYLRGRPVPALLWLLVALSTDITVAWVVATGSIVLTAKGNGKAGLVTLGLGSAVAAADLWALHGLNPSSWPFLAQYWPDAMPSAVWAHSVVSFGNLRFWLYIAWVLVPLWLFGFWPGARLWAVPVVAVILLNVSAQTPGPTSPYTQYSVLAVPFLMLGLTESLGRRSSIPRFRALQVAAYVACLAVIGGHLVQSRHDLVPSAQAAALAQAVDTVAPTAPVFTQNFIAPHFGSRLDLYSLHPNQIFPAGSVVVLDPSHSTGLTPPALVAADVQLLSRHARVVFDKNGVYVFVVPERTKGDF